MSRTYGLTDELLALVEANPGITAAKLFQSSNLASSQHVVYSTMYALKTSGRVIKDGRGYWIGGDEAESDGEDDRKLGWELPDDETESEHERKSSQARKPEPAVAPSGGAESRPVPPTVADPDAALPRSTVRTKDPSGELFREFLGALLNACRKDENPALRELADRVEKHKPEDLG